jgi:hypothetical protein
MVIDQYLICGKCGKASLRRFSGLCPDCERKERGEKINYAMFKQLADRWQRGRITKESLIRNWFLAQKDQGIKPYPWTKPEGKKIS